MSLHEATKSEKITEMLVVFRTKCNSSPKRYSSRQLSTGKEITWDANAFLPHTQQKLIQADSFVILNAELPKNFFGAWAQGITNVRNLISS